MEKRMIINECEKMRRLFRGYHEHTLSEQETGLVREHFMLCGPCGRAYLLEYYPDEAGAPAPMSFDEFMGQTRLIVSGAVSPGEMLIDKIITLSRKSPEAASRAAAGLGLPVVFPPAFWKKNIASETESEYERLEGVAAGAEPVRVEILAADEVNIVFQVEFNPRNPKTGATPCARIRARKKSGGDYLPGIEIILIKVWKDYEKVKATTDPGNMNFARFALEEAESAAAPSADGYSFTQFFNSHIITTSFKPID